MYQTRRYTSRDKRSIGEIGRKANLILERLSQCHDVERIIHHRRPEDPEIASISVDFDFFHDHSARLELWDHTLLTDKCRYSGTDIERLEEVDELMLVLEALDHLIHLLTESSMMPLEIVRESEIVRCSERWDTGECDLTSRLGQTRDETI